MCGTPDERIWAASVEGSGRQTLGWGLLAGSLLLLGAAGVGYAGLRRR